MPHPTTLMKLTTRCGSAAIDGLNEALLAKAAEAKLLGTNRIRADTTVARANVSYPTDLGLLAKAMRRIAATGKRIQAAGGAVRTRVGDPDLALLDRVRTASIPDAQSPTSTEPYRDPGSGLELRLRRPHQHCRPVYLLSEEEDRLRPGANDPYGPRHWIHAASAGMSLA